MELQVNVIGAEKVSQGFVNFIKRYTPEMTRALNKASIVIESEAKRNAPVDTGRLRASITHRIGGYGKDLFAEVGTNVKYARYVEEGTRPHLAPVGKWAERHGIFSKYKFGKSGFERVKGSSPKWLWVSGKSQPYIKPAYESKMNEAIDIIFNQIRDLVRTM